MATVKSRQKYCTCGYLRSGVLPEQLCFDCGDTVLAQWVEEERRLLRTLPAYKEEVTRIVRETSLKQKKAILARVNEPLADAYYVRLYGAHQLAKLRRKHKRELAELSLDRWHNYAAAAARDPRESQRNDAKRFARRGLGAAALTVLGVRSIGTLIARRRLRRR